jgi:hypothetical protein
MTMRALDRLKEIQRVADGNLKPGQAAGRLGLTVRQVRRLVRRYEAQGATGLYQSQVMSSSAQASSKPSYASTVNEWRLVSV